MAGQILEGTWEEIAKNSESLVGRRVRITILDNEILRTPNRKLLDVIRQVENNQKDRNETEGESGVEIVRRGRSGEMFSGDSDEQS